MYTQNSLYSKAVLCMFLSSNDSFTRHLVLMVARVVKLVHIYPMKPLEIIRVGGAIYPPSLALHHTGCSTEKGISTFQGLGA